MTLSQTTPPLRDEGGFTLVELLVAALVAVVVLGMIGTVLAHSVSHTNQATSRTEATRAVKAGVDRLARDLRSATAATIADDGTVATAVLTVPVRQTVASTTPPSTTVTWTCTDGGSCTRRAGGGPVETAVPHVTAASLTPTARDGSTAASLTDPAYVAIEVSSRVAWLPDPTRARTAPQAKRPVTVRDGVDLRNFSFAAP